MMAMLVLDDVHNKQRGFIKSAMAAGRLAGLCAKTCRPPWVAEVTCGGRCFVRGHWDYARATGPGGRVTVTFFLRSGCRYEVSDPAARRRYFCRVVDGRVEEE
jgi:hypothetical protein